jgi:hypothetical protein
VWRGFDMTDLDSARVAAFTNADDEDNEGAEVARVGEAGGRSPDERSDIRGGAKLSRMSLRSSGLLAGDEVSRLASGSRECAPDDKLRVTHRLVAGERRITLR